MQKIQGYHAHIYFDENTKKSAEIICQVLRGQCTSNTLHCYEKAIGPHPKGNYSLHVHPSDFTTITRWLSFNRDGLTVLVHPVTSDEEELINHTDRAIWMGEILQLDLTAL